MSLKRPAVLFAAFLIFSAFAAGSNIQFTALLVAAFLMVVACAAFVKKRKKVCVTFLLCAVACSYAIVFTRITQLVIQNRLSEPVENASFCAITEDVSSYGNGATVYARITSPPYDGIRVVMSLKNDTLPPTVYEKINFEGTLSPIIGKEYSGGVLGSEKYFVANGYFVRVEISDFRVVGLPDKSELSFVGKYYFHIYDCLVRNMPYIGNTDTFPYALALLTGDRTRFYMQKYRGFSMSGLTPFMCISGLHVAIASDFLNAVLKRLKLKDLPAAIITLLFLAVITMVTGAGGSVVRASIMSAVLVISRLCGKRSDGYSALACAFILISLHNPYSIYDYGTLLSFLCMLGLVCAGYSADYFSDTSQRINLAVRRPLITAFYAFGFSGTVTASNFGGIYLLSPFSNLVAATVFSPIMYLLTATAFFSFLPDVLLKILMYPAALLIKLFEIISDTFAAIPNSYSTADFPPYLTFICAALLLLHVVMCAVGNNRHHTASGFFAAAVPLVSVTLLHAVSAISNLPVW